MGTLAEGQIRLARPEDLDEVMALYDRARAFMRAHGNSAQWTGGYPFRALAEEDCAAGHLWVLEGAHGEKDDGAADSTPALLAVMTVLSGPDPTYAEIAGKPWLNDEPYTVMHRLAVGESGHGAGGRCLAWLCAQHDNVRADTHELNEPMQRALERAGFVRRGTITLGDGSPRVAYHFVR